MDILIQKLCLTDHSARNNRIYHRYLYCSISPQKVFNSSGLAVQFRAEYSNMANIDSDCLHAIPTIALDLKLSQSTVRRALNDLRKEKLLTTEQRYRSNGGMNILLFKLEL